MSAPRSSAALETANTSSAVMQQRKEPHDSLDYFPTPAWATRALCEWMSGEGHLVPGMTVWEPACGEGWMAKPLAEYFKTVRATDVHDYAVSAQDAVADFLEIGGGKPDPIPNFIITNPPFRLAQQFARRAFEIADDGVALLVRSAFLEGKDRYETLFSLNPPTAVLQFVERVPMVRGVVDRAASSATAYAWIVWIDGEPGTRLCWLRPCRKRLERDEDYPSEAIEIEPLNEGLFS